MSAAVHKVTMPKWGLSMQEGTVVAWLVDEGVEVAAGDEIVEIETEIVERLAHIEIGLAGGDDTEAPPRAIADHPVEFVGTHEGARRVELVLVQARLLVERRVRPADVEAAFGQAVIARQFGMNALRVDRDDGR